MSATSVAMARSAAARSMCRPPPSRASRSSHPSTTSASVTVGLRATEAIGRRSRVGAGAGRPDLQRAARIDPGDRAAAGADLGQVDDRHADRMAGAVHPALGVGGAADFILGRHRDFVADDHAGLRRRAAHVEGDQVGATELTSGQGCGDHAGGGAGFHRHRRHAQAFGDVEHAAGGSHDMQRRQPRAVVAFDSRSR